MFRASPENFTPTLLVVLETFRRSENRPQNIPHEKGHQTDTQTQRQTHGHRNY